MPLLLSLLLLLAVPMASLEDRLAALEASTLAMRSTVSELGREAIRSRRYRDAGDASSLEARLDPGTLVGIPAYRSGAPSTLPDLGRPLLARLRDDASMPGLAAGSNDPVQGYANLLADPTFDTTAKYTGGQAIGTALTEIGPEWRAKYVLNSGTVATTVSVDNYARRGPQAAPLMYGSSGILEFALVFGVNASDMTIYLDNTNAYSTSGPGIPSWLVGSLRTGTLFYSNVTITTNLEIVDNSGVVIATGDIADLVPLYAMQEQASLEVGYAGPAASTNYRWRLRLDVTKTAGSAGAANVLITEPLLAFSNDGSAGMFTPAVGAWLPGVPGYQLVTRTFVYQDIGAGATLTAARSDIAMPTVLQERWGGSIVGAAYRMDNTTAAGTLTVKVQVNGSDVWTPFSITSGSPQGDRATQYINTDAFVAGDEIKVVLVTNAGFLPTTRDIIVELDLLLTYTGG